MWWRWRWEHIVVETNCKTTWTLECEENLMDTITQIINKNKNLKALIP
jgi:hypothetical protein